MPTDRFYRLPREKSDAIRMAAIREFKRVPLEEASINRIIRDADISRGSFYTYFEDKKELLNWLIEDAIKDIKRFYVRTIQINGGDIWDLFEKALDYELDVCEKDNIIEIIMNVARSNVMGEVFMPGHGCSPGQDGGDYRFGSWIYSRCDKIKCPLDMDSFLILMEMHFLSVIISMKQYFQERRSKEQVKQDYLRRIQMLHYGVCPADSSKA